MCCIEVPGTLTCIDYDKEPGDVQVSSYTAEYDIETPDKEAVRTQAL